MNNIESDSGWNPIQIQPELISVRRFRKQIDVVPSTVWRWIQRGWLGRPCNISGRLYLTREQIEEFKRRAVAGEFAVNIRPPRPAKGPKSGASLHSVRTVFRKPIDPKGTLCRLSKRRWRRRIDQMPCEFCVTSLVRPSVPWPDASFRQISPFRRNSRSQLDSSGLPA